jgi:hypothetical protein
MKNVFGIRVVAGIMVLCFLCGCILPPFDESEQTDKQDESEVPLTADSQGPDEGQGEEGERDFTDDDKQYKFQGNLLLISTMAPSAITTAIDSNLRHTADLIPGSTSYGIPIYLVNKRLLI